MKNFNTTSKAAALAMLGTASIGSAMADGFTVPPDLAAAVVSVGLVGAAVFSIGVAVKLYKWIKSAL